MANPQNASLEDFQENATAVNLKIRSGANENPGELAGSTGAETFEEVAPLSTHHSLNRSVHTTALWAKSKAACMGKRERVAFAWAALASLDPAAAIATVESVIGAAGAPLPSFLAPMSDARWWASMANGRELKAYALARFEAMQPADQSAFLGHVQGRAAA